MVGKRKKVKKNNLALMVVVGIILIGGIIFVLNYGGIKFWLIEPARSDVVDRLVVCNTIGEDCYGEFMETEGLGTEVYSDVGGMDLEELDLKDLFYSSVSDCFNEENKESCFLLVSFVYGFNLDNYKGYCKYYSVDKNSFNYCVDFGLHSLAAYTEDAEICKEISAESRDACYLIVARASEDVEVCAMLADPGGSYYPNCVITVARKSGNPDLCGTLEDSRDMEICYNIFDRLAEM